jgi:hypothetical protein
MTFFSAQKARAGTMNDLIDQDSVLPLGIQARGNRTTSSTTTTTEVGVLRLDDIPIYAGRTYRIWTSPLRLDTSVANDVARANIRYTTDGSTPTTSSTVMTNAQALLANIADGDSVDICIDYSPSADELLSLLLCVARQSGTGNISIIAASTTPINMVVEDIGLDPTDTGTDI